MNGHDRHSGNQPRRCHQQPHVVLDSTFLLKTVAMTRLSKLRRTTEETVAMRRPYILSGPYSWTEFQSCGRRVKCSLCRSYFSWLYIFFSFFGVGLGLHLLPLDAVYLSLLSCVWPVLIQGCRLLIYGRSFRDDARHIITRPMEDVAARQAGRRYSTRIRSS